MATNNLPQTVKVGMDRGHITSSVIYLSPAERDMLKADKGGLKTIGGNIGMSCPICVDVIDDAGNMFSMKLGELLPRLNEFHSYINRRRESETLLNACFIAYENQLMTDEEQIFFDSFVRTRIAQKASTGSLELARSLLLNSNN